MENNASECSACDGCRWQNASLRSHPIDWCYMFHVRPEELPCTQHDKFGGIRECMVKSGLAMTTAIALGISSTNPDSGPTGAASQ